LRRSPRERPDDEADRRQEDERIGAGALGAGPRRDDREVRDRV
jgi:hypothetical protein